MSSSYPEGPPLRTAIARADDLGGFGILLSHTGLRELATQLRREPGRCWPRSAGAVFR